MSCQEYNSSYFLIKVQDCYKTLCEVVSRRDIHVHKRGIVDVS